MSHAQLLGRSLVASLVALVLVGCGGGDNAKPDAAVIHDPDASIDAAGPVTWPALAAIPLTSPDGSFWGPMFSVGGQMFLMDLDTGSTTTAVAGKGCTTCTTAGVTPLYMPGTGAVDQHKPTSTQYADGSGWMGEVYKDSVGLGHGTPNLAIAFGDIATQTSFFLDNSYQGILGLGAPENAEPDTDSYFDLARQSGAVPIMAFELCPTTGTMWLGGFDPTRASAAPGYTPLVPITVDAPFYSIDISSMSIGATAVATSVADFQEAGVGSPTVDTGTSLFYAPTAVVPKILAAINASAGFQALFGPNATLTSIESPSGGCITKAGVTAAMVDAMLPALTFTVPNKTTGSPDVSFTVKPMVSYMYDGGANQWCFGIDDDQGGGVTLGDQIMQAFVTIIDLQNQQVGFAPDSGCASHPPARRPIQRSTFHPHLPHPRPHHHH